MTRSLLLNLYLAPFTFLFSTGSSAQDFAPFNTNSRKLFATPDNHTTFGIAFDSTTVSGGTTTFHNYKTVWDTLTPSNCGWWGEQECAKQDRPTWAGPRIEVTADGTHTFFNLWNEPITLAFSTEPGSQTLMYADGSEQFLLSYVGESPLEVLGFTENVRQWTILHEDLNGDPINSPLNNAPVLVCGTIGLASYFRADSFPLVLQPVGLAGQAEPALGVNAITPAFLNDFQPGDEIQMHNYANYYTGPPSLDHNIYRKIKVLSRTDSPDNVSYELETTVYNVDSGTTITGTSSQTFSRTEVIAVIPYDRVDGTGSSLAVEDYCGLPLWTYRTYLNLGWAYCPAENCWGPFDTNGPPPSGGSTLVGGLGTYAFSESIMQPTGYSISSNIVYFKKNGVECMNEVVMSAPEVMSAENSMIVSPNPADAVFNYRSSARIASLEILDTQGRTFAGLLRPGRSGSVETTTWPRGIYVVRFTLEDGSTATRRMVISR